MLTSPPVSRLAADALLLFADLRREEFRRLDESGEAYLDYASTALYAESQVRGQAQLLRRVVLGDPGGDGSAARTTAALVEQARASVLTFLDADPREYRVIFTASTTAAVRIVAEGFPFTAASLLLLAADNHECVNAIRSSARAAGARVRQVPLDQMLHLVRAAELLRTRRRGPHLFAFPAQSNFSGVQHPLELIDEAHRRGFSVLLDAAAYVPTNPISLHDIQPDFLCLSFHKLMGLPTGLGALVARRSVMAKLRQRELGTWSDTALPAEEGAVRPLAEDFEDGMPNFLGIAALAPGFELLERLTMIRIREHVRTLTATLLEGLGSLRHRNGAPLVRLYGPPDTRQRGGIVALNVLGDDGRIIPGDAVVSRARSLGVSIRAGCFRNLGAASRAFAFESDRVGASAVRVSLGIANGEAEVLRCLESLASWRDAPTPA